MALDARLDVRVDADVTFAFTVTNPTTERVELTFRDGRTADVVVHEDDTDEDELSDVVWRWSDGRAFIQEIRTSTLAPGEEACEKMVWKNPIPGSYTAVATLAASGTAVHAENTFVVEESSD